RSIRSATASAAAAGALLLLLLEERTLRCQRDTVLQLQFRYRVLHFLCQKRCGFFLVLRPAEHGAVAIPRVAAAALVLIIVGCRVVVEVVGELIITPVVAAAPPEPPSYPSSSSSSSDHLRCRHAVGAAPGAAAGASITSRHRFRSDEAPSSHPPGSAHADAASGPAGSSAIRIPREVCFQVFGWRP
ncbi:unnamed protein product, partial [Ectocarpus sp. 12 AP-2014]